MDAIRSHNATMVLELNTGDIVRIEAINRSAAARLVGTLIVDGQEIQEWDEDLQPGDPFADEVRIP